MLATINQTTCVISQDAVTFMITDVRASNFCVFLVSSAINCDGTFVRDRPH
jgi:hypothetical protein